ncbi:hypothetical protein CRUP_018008 [Coryphaenoides rupestris]|nr:hypothetical protein CRUP_018008 [Coryphaenoides rupestris]
MTQSVSFSTATAESFGDVTYYDEYDDYNDSLGEINRHLCHYGRPGASFLPAVYSLLFLVGLPGNVLVVWVMAAGARLRSMTDVCLLNLAVADLLLLSALPFLAHQARHQWSFGEGACKAVLATYHVGFYASIFFLVLMSVDRYLAIVHAVFALRARTRSFGVLAAAVTWAAGILAAFPEAGFLQAQTYNGTVFCAPLYDDEHDPAGHGGRHWWTVFGLLKMNVLGLVVPLVIMSFCYGRIVHTLLSRLSSKMPAVRLIAAVVAVFFCCWLPYNVTCLFRALEMMDLYKSCESSDRIRRAGQVTEVIAYGHSCLNPVLYVFVGERFRRQLLRLVGGLCPAVRRWIPGARERRQSSAYSQSTSIHERSTAV